MTTEDMERVIRDLTKRIERLEAEAAISRKVAHYPPPSPLREPTYRTLGRKIADESGVELD